MAQLSRLLEELKAISPMPSDEELEEQGEEGIYRLDLYAQLIPSIRQAVQPTFPKEALTTLLNSFGIGGGGEVYWSMVHLIETYPDKSTLHQAIQHASRGSFPGTRKWCCLLLQRQQSPEDVSFLLERLHDPVLAVRGEALSALGWLAQIYPLSECIPPIRELLTDESKSVQEAAKKLLTRLQGTED